ncbi:MAG: hypothetical protein B7C24_00420 [Bacteroidetes bacterium 4572_77]|nr:MAG: hypothetical protein B7C24_00420 [Bacteroidetes bacterium 4572_77]
MENIELKTLYNEKLKPYLHGLEKDRLYIKKRLIGGLVLAQVLLFGVASITNQIVMWISIVLLLITLLWLAGTGIAKYASYRHQFKEEIVSKIINLINPDYKYDAYRQIRINDFNAAGLFKKAEMGRGDDYVSGRIGKTVFHYSEINAGKVTDNNSNAKIQSVFKGLFFFADFNKTLKGETYVLPDKMEKLLGKMGQKYQSNHKKGELVKLENPEFEKEYVVYASSQIEARYVLTPTMMEAMTNIRKQYPFAFHFSFVGNRVNCAISFKEALFEPKIMKSGVSYKDVEYIHHLFGLIELLINEMNLNTRIWTKE